MIKPEELRIRNYVTDDDNFIYTVKGVKGNSIDTTGDEKYHDMFFFNPIPLTEEWLLRLGFVLTYKSGYRRKYDLEDFLKVGYDITTPEGSEFNKGFRYIGEHTENVIYVHQLQNIFYALTGEELTLKE